MIYNRLPQEILKLPIASVLADLRTSLCESSNVVLQAAPGTGKSTGAPLALLGADWLGNNQIVMLEPRRLAARATACRMAELLGENAGATVGYRMRADVRESGATKILVVTEGVLLRMLHDDPALEGVGLLIFDEYHERSLNADLGLALALDVQAMWRPELRVLVMSATLENERIAELLQTKAVVEANGRMFPVETRHESTPVGKNAICEVVARTILRTLREESGGILVFLPGAREIRRVHELLKNAELAKTPGLNVFALHGRLPRSVQNAAISPSPPGIRKLVLATDIAETSLTIDGVRVVIDSGLRRVPRFSPRTGMTRLETVLTSRASSEQRRGRAGRTGPGVCHRLWSVAEHAGRPEFDVPEMYGADLAGLALELADWGVHDPGRLRWLDEPPTAAFAQAVDLLAQLGAVDRAARITRHGREMIELGMHPRLAHMLLCSKSIGLENTACRIAAILSERDMLIPTDSQASVDLELRLEALDKIDSGKKRIEGMNIDVVARRNIDKLTKRWLQQLGVTQKRKPEKNINAAGIVLALAYPDRIAARRSEKSRIFLLGNGRGAELPSGSPLAGSPYLVVADLDDTGRNAFIRLAAAIAESELMTFCKDEIQVVRRVEWCEREQRVVACKEQRLGEIVLDRVPLSKPAPEKVTAALLEGIRGRGLNCLPWNRESKNLRARIQFLHKTFGSNWPDVSEQNLVDNLERWLAPFLGGMVKLADLSKLDLATCIKSFLNWRLQQRLDLLAPTHIPAPSGSRIKLDYQSGEIPKMSVRLQEMFGLTETPRIADGRMPILVELLSPAHRPVQVTQDLANFWNETYQHVKKELKGRYPRHYWPDDPWQAIPTRNTTKKRAS